MKRCMILFLILALMLMGCSNQNTFEKPCSFYYLHTESDAVQVDGIMTVQIQEGHNLEIMTLLKRYLEGPTDPAMRSPFPAGLKLESMKLTENTLYLTLSDEFARLSGIAQTLACACLCRTCFELTQVEFIEIRCATEKFNGKDFLTFDRQIICYHDTFQPDSVPADTQEG